MLLPKSCDATDVSSIDDKPANAFDSVNPNFSMVTKTLKEILVTFSLANVIRDEVIRFAVDASLMTDVILISDCAILPPNPRTKADLNAST